MPGAEKPSPEALLPDAPQPQPVTSFDKFQAFVEQASSPLTFGAAGLNAVALREIQEHAPPGMQSSFTTLYEASVDRRNPAPFSASLFTLRCSTGPALLSFDQPECGRASRPCCFASGDHPQ